MTWQTVREPRVLDPSEILLIAIIRRDILDTKPSHARRAEGRTAR